MENKSIKLHFFDNSPSHFVLSTIIKNRLLSNIDYSILYFSGA